MGYLFQVSIGPVQPFIASARRTRDLWFGSHLLSELSRTAAQTIEMNGGRLIFPASSDKKTYSVANKVLAVIHEPPHELDAQLRQAISLYLHTHKNAIYEQCRGVQWIDKHTMAQQLDDLIELNWVALPYNSSTSYSETRAWLEAIMSRRKNIRNFRKVTWGATHHKSSIDGQLEAVIAGSRYPERRDSLQERSWKAKNLYALFKVNPTERLSGVDLFKRLGAEQEGKAVLSTSHVATLPYLERLKKLDSIQQATARKNLWKYIQQAQEIAELDTLHFNKDEATFTCFDHFILRSETARQQLLDGAIFFPQRLLDRDPNPNTNTAINAATLLLDDFFRSVDTYLRDRDAWQASARPSPYYAMLKADGDSMGKIIDAWAKREDGMQRHQRLSQALDDFAASVPDSVYQYQGMLIYAGGDDVLALLPLHTVVDCAHTLSDKFKSKLDEFKIDGLTPGLSVGIAIVHHLELLDEARELVGKAEHQAKGVEGKNALAILLSKRSGETYTVADQWGKLDTTLQNLMYYCYQQIIPGGMAYELRDSAQRLGTALPEVLLSDVKRIIHRKLFVPQPKDTQKAQEAERYLWKQLGIKDDSSIISPTSSVNMNDFAHALIIAQMLADAKRVALVEVQPL